jgi:hypothetical protein
MRLGYSKCRGYPIQPLAEEKHQNTGRKDFGNFKEPSARKAKIMIKGELL